MFLKNLKKIKKIQNQNLCFELLIYEIKSNQKKKKKKPKAD